MDKKMNVLDVQLDDYTAKDAMKAVTGFMQTEPVSTVEILTVDVLMRASETEGIKSSLEELDLVLAGDEAILEAAEVTEKKKLQDVQNQSFLKMLFHYFHKSRTRVFVLVDAKEEIDAARAFLEENYRGIEIAGIEVVPDDESADDMIINRINGAEADCVLAGLSSPKQENFICRVHGVLNARLWLGVGKGGTLSSKKTGVKERFRDFWERKILKREVEKKRKEI
ncbi:WecB/TagA/CpsF family glycosyltransferase [Roseburia hominis]